MEAKPSPFVFVELVLILLAAVVFPFAVLFTAFWGTPPAWEFLHPAMICLYAAAVFLFLWARFGAAASWRAFACILAISFLVEYWGLKAGWPFGPYRYTPKLGPALSGVPLVIPLAWFAATAAAWGCVRLLLHPGPAPLAHLRAALLVLSLDLVLEPAAAFVHGYWIWEGNRIPLQNYVAWLIVALLLASVSFPHPATLAKRELLDFVPAAVFGMLWFLFAVTAFVHGYNLTVGISAIVLSVALSEKEKGAA